MEDKNWSFKYESKQVQAHIFKSNNDSQLEKVLNALHL